MERLSLGFFPTPLEFLPRLTAALKGPQIWIKRDDQTGLACGGNKTRKLEFLLADALRHDADAIITAGAAQSNHCRQTAAASAKLGLPCHLLLGGHEPERRTGNLLLNEIFGAQIHWSGSLRKGELEQELAQKLRAQGQNPYVVPYGGSNPMGVQGFIAAIAELKSQLITQDLKIDTIIVASSSGGTQAGMAVGLRKSQLNCQLIGIAIDKDEGTLLYEAQLAALATAASQDNFSAQDFTVNRNYLGNGYGVVGEAERNAIALLAKTEGILLDPVYTGRAFAGLIDLIQQQSWTKNQNVLFWHTGGIPALFDLNFSI